jgi:hypothetical protein
MGSQTQIRPPSVGPVPQTSAQAQRTILSIAMLVDGFLDTDPGQFEERLRNCNVMPQAKLLLASTMCRRPLVAREFASVCGGSGFDGILVRVAGDPSSPVVTFDVHQAEGDTMHWAYRLWMRVRWGQAWLMPVAGEGTFVRLDPLGLEFSELAPFDCNFERARGLCLANEYLSIATTKGWF